MTNIVYAARKEADLDAKDASPGDVFMFNDERETSYYMKLDTGAVVNLTTGHYSPLTKNMAPVTLQDRVYIEKLP